MGGKKLTYAGVGINLEKRRETVGRYRDVSKGATRPEVLSGVGPFGGLFALGSSYRDPVLVSSTDGVGTKVKIAAAVGRYEGLGHDLVNQSVNDALTCGAQPLFFLDYIANADLTPEQKVALVKGVADACEAAGCALLGGETSDMPDVYRPGDFDMAGFVVGVVERDSLIDGSGIVAGDLLFGLPSNGLHTNGYSLARPALGVCTDATTIEADRGRLLRFDPDLGESLADALLKPHTLYTTAIKPALSLIKGMSHNTGGGFEENLPRMLPDGLGARLEKSSWPVPPIFPYIQRAGDIDEAEMYRVFNMGLGFVFAVSPDAARRVHSLIPSALHVGEVVAVSDGGDQVILA
ncbi:MAG TPA: phosphoribosylformylglycinamidine cyclo-ligase [Dehalococcoidia bacterium]|jgi:phosphoribosylformylglycinamidine cyclo-ligase|nr:phosphoribosylformylglycinamidine cyclo-ligase [Dehalococcoidia bacterium]